MARGKAREVTGDGGDEEIHRLRLAHHWEDFSFYSQEGKVIGVDPVCVLTGLAG